jgi:hypothetical protein
MNERIKQITGQVLDEIVPYTWTTLGYDKIKEIQNRTAELIVKECARIGELKEQGSSEYDSDMSVGWYMRQHFGVEE